MEIDSMAFFFFNIRNLIFEIEQDPKRHQEK